MILKEVRREDELYFQGPFWIIGDSQLAINKGEFKLIGEKFPVNFDGEYLNDFTGKKSITAHKKLWDNYKSEYGDVEYDYYPRGRVRIVSGVPFIHINSKMNNPRVINAIIDMYDLYKLRDNISIEEDDLIQGSHYNFKLK